MKREKNYSFNTHNTTFFTSLSTYKIKHPNSMKSLSMKCREDITDIFKINKKLKKDIH